MADPLTALGATAAICQIAVQLVQSTISITEFLKKLKNAPDLVRKQNAHVEQLNGIARLIIQNASLQTDSISSMLESCLHQAEELRRLFLKDTINGTDGSFVKLQKALTSAMNDKKAQKMFSQLEREKTLLMLCIQEIDSKVLDQIDFQVTSVQNDVNEVAFVVNDTQRDIKSIVDTVPRIAADTSTMTEKITALHDDMLPTLLQRIQMSPDDPDPASSQAAPIHTYYNVPNRLACPFLGRENVLARIDRGLSKTSSPRVVVVQGMGGQGKSQIALEYCRRKQKDSFSAIFWLDASSESSIRRSFAEISEYIKPPDLKLSTPHMRVSYVLQSLGSWRGKLLFVFDNYDDPCAFSLWDYIPSSELGTILVTSRHADTRDLTPDAESFIELQGLDKSTAVELLALPNSNAESETDALAIVERLGYHPLAITQASSYIRQRRIKSKDFMDHYDRRKELILRNTPQLSQYRRKLGGSETETSLNVFTTWELSYQQLQSRTGESAVVLKLLTLLSFFDHKDIPETFFSEYRHWPEIWEQEDLEGFGQYSGQLRWLEEFTDGKEWQSDLFEDALITLKDS